MPSQTTHRQHIEHVPVVVMADSVVASNAVAREIAALIRERQADNREAVLGLATGSTPIGVYRELVRLHRQEGLSFRNVVSFNLDEYLGLSPAHVQSYHHFMRAHLFDHIDVPAENIHVPDGMVPLAELEVSCRRYDETIRAAGGIDFQLLGIGRSGHIGFNEPGSSRRSRTRLITLDAITRRDAAPDFGGMDHTPQHAITMGVQTILEARRVVLLAWGKHKAHVIHEAVEGEMSSRVTASFLQDHDDVRIVVDPAAASMLTRFRAPWLSGPLPDQGLAWDNRMTRRGVIWAAQHAGKPILKLTEEDYAACGLEELLRVRGSAYYANLAGFYHIQHTITGWPGGRNPAQTKPGDALVRPLRASSAEVFPKRILVVSPHPDDYVTAMGGTVCRLVEQGHEVHLAYQTSGSKAVTDEALWRALRLVIEGGMVPVEHAARLQALCRQFELGGAVPQDPEVIRWKKLIRRQEACAAARVCGIDLVRQHFLNLPFYETSAGRAKELSSEDAAITRKTLEHIRPHLIYVASGSDDPHGVHQQALTALRDALAGVEADWLGELEIWMYANGPTAWELHDVDLAVPLSPREVLRRREAGFRHETQKESALLRSAGREGSWLEDEYKSLRLAEDYNALGLAEYEAIEAFKRFSPQEFRAEPIM